MKRAFSPVELGTAADLRGAERRTSGVNLVAMIVIVGEEDRESGRGDAEMARYIDSGLVTSRVSTTSCWSSSDSQTEQFAAIQRNELLRRR